MLLKVQRLGRTCCCNEEKNQLVSFPGCSEASSIQLSQRENTSFANRPQFPGSQKYVSLQFQICVNILAGHNVPFHEKRGQGRVL